MTADAPDDTPTHGAFVSGADGVEILDGLDRDAITEAVTGRLIRRGQA